MNTDKIKELSRQAHLYACEQYGKQRKGELVWNPDVYEMKFAELIIDECITEINLCRCSNRSVPYEKLDLFDQGEAQAVSCAIEAIKHNFGIKA